MLSQRALAIMEEALRPKHPVMEENHPIHGQSNPAVAHVGGHNSFRAASHSSRIGGFAARRNFADRASESQSVNISGQLNRQKVLFFQIQYVNSAAGVTYDNASSYISGALWHEITTERSNNCCRFQIPNLQCPIGRGGDRSAPVRRHRNSSHRVGMSLKEFKLASTL